jgi:hypothetical protein
MGNLSFTLDDVRHIIEAHEVSKNDRDKFKLLYLELMKENHKLKLDMIKINKLNSDMKESLVELRKDLNTYIENVMGETCPGQGDCHH